MKDQINMFRPHDNSCISHVLKSRILSIIIMNSFERNKLFTYFFKKMLLGEKMLLYSFGCYYIHKSCFQGQFTKVFEFNRYKQPLLFMFPHSRDKHSDIYFSFSLSHKIYKLIMNTKNNLHYKSENC